MVAVVGGYQSWVCRVREIAVHTLRRCKVVRTQETESIIILSAVAAVGMDFYG